MVVLVKYWPFTNDIQCRNDMRQSTLFTKTRKNTPKDEVAKNAQLLIRAGYIHKEMAGAYALLPLGLRVHNKIENIIRQEMNSIGGQEIILPALQSSEVWKKSGRWDDAVIDVWFKTFLKDGGELGLGTTHEEPITALMKEFIQSYKDLPRYPYQFQNKFRNELRAKSGILRTREFVMKDLYSFSKDEAEFRLFYEEIAAAYMRVFTRVGLGEKTYRTFASGGSFSNFSDEFQTVCEAGEDTIYVHEGNSASRRIAVNKEVYTDDVLKELGIKKEQLKEVSAREGGDIFPLGTKYSSALGLKYKDEEGKMKPVYMGSYGIGPGRLMGTVVEVLSDEKGIVWPREVSPFDIHLVAITGGNKDVVSEADRIDELLQEHGVEVLYDDRDVRAGEKFTDADLIGISQRLVVSEKTVAEGRAELSERKSSGGGVLVPESPLIERIRQQSV